MGCACWIIHEVTIQVPACRHCILASVFCLCSFIIPGSETINTTTIIKYTTFTTLTVFIYQKFSFIETYVPGTVLNAFVHFFFHLVPQFLVDFSHKETKVENNLVTCLVKLTFQLISISLLAIMLFCLSI